jgi:hypothetical protein
MRIHGFDEEGCERKEERKNSFWDRDRCGLGGIVNIECLFVFTSE